MSDQSTFSLPTETVLRWMGRAFLVGLFVGTWAGITALLNG
jgi:hypothetical protein